MQKTSQRSSRRAIAILHTPMDTIKLKKDSEDELVDRALYKHIIGSLRYICNTRPIIYQCVEFVSRFMEKPRLCHLLKAMRILRYIRGTTGNGVLMSNQQNTILKKAKVYGYSNPD